MSGAQVQLEAGGTFVQDPQKTLFSINYKPRDVYIAESFEVPFDRSKPQFGGTVSATIPPKSDIVRRLTVRSELPELYTPLGPGYVYPLYTDEVDGSVFVQTNTLAIQPGDFVGYFNTQFLSAWATNFVGYANLSVAYDSSAQKFVFTSPTYSNIFFKNEQSASFWGFDIRSPDFLTPTGSYPAYNFSGGTLTSQLTVVQAGWIRGFTPPPSSGFSYVDSVGTKLIKSVELKIGGQTIDRLTGERLYLEDDLGVAYENQAGLTILEGKNDTSIVTAPREYYTRLTFDMDVLNMAQLYRQDVRVDVEYEKFENLPSNVITTNSLTDGGSYVNTPWKTLNSISTDPFIGRVHSMVFWKQYIVYAVGLNPLRFWFYDTTKPVGLASSWTAGTTNIFGSNIGRFMTVGSNIYYSRDIFGGARLGRISISSLLSGSATTTEGPPYLEGKYVSIGQQVGTAGGAEGICADARYIYISYAANMVSFGSNSAALVSRNWFTTDSNATATFNVYSIATSQLIASDNAAVITYMGIFVPSPTSGVTKNTATIVSQNKIGSNVIVVSNVAYTYTSNGQPALQTFDRYGDNVTTIWVRYDTTQSISSISSYDYLTWPGTGAPRSWRDISGAFGVPIPSFYPSSDGRYIYTSNPYFFKTDTHNFLNVASYTYFDINVLSPVPELPGFVNVPNASDGRYIYFRSIVNSSGSATLIRYDSTASISSPSSYSSIVYSGFGGALVDGYELVPIGFDGKSVYYAGSSRDQNIGGTYYFVIAMTFMRVDCTSFTVTDWIVFDGYGKAKTSNGPVSNTISFTSLEGTVPSVATPVMAVGSRYIYIGEQWYGGFQTYTDFIQFDPLTMSNTLSSSLIVKYEKYVERPPPMKKLYGQTDVEEFIMRPGRNRDTFQLRFTGPVSEFWVTIDTPGVISRLILRLNNEVLIDDDQVTARYIRPFETHTTMPTSNICTYAVALDPEKLVSSGSLNMSRIAYPTLEVFLTSSVPSDTKLRVYTRSLNVLEYKSGVGGLLFNSAL